ncbi:hypothetical protein J27TS7_33060 [Paenibacillus dendritiformis]|nr:hypothetical protein J27TS7_33060 [Paenibacillus dendritiformis]
MKKTLITISMALFLFNITGVSSLGDIGGGWSVKDIGTGWIVGEIGTGWSPMSNLDGVISSA